MSHQKQSSTYAGKPARPPSTPRRAALQDIEPLYLRVPQILQRYGFCRATFYKLMKEGKLPRPFHPTGRRLSLWCASELEEAIQQLRAPAN